MRYDRARIVWIKYVVDKFRLVHPRPWYRSTGVAGSSVSEKQVLT